MATGQAIRLNYRHGTGKFTYKDPLNIVYPETVYIDNSGDISLGAGVTISRGVTIMTHDHVFATETPVSETFTRIGTLDIGDDVFIGVNAIIGPQVRKIGRGAVIGAGSVLTKDVGEHEVWAGNPARKVRDLECQAKSSSDTAPDVAEPRA